MPSQCKVKANRVNAGASTGPRTAQGKARAAQNARRHGLSLPVAMNSLFADQIAALARKFVGSSTDSEAYKVAYEAAAAQIDLDRIRWARHDLVTQHNSSANYEELAKLLLRIDRYERRAVSRRKFAIRGLAAALVMTSQP